MRKMIAAVTAGLLLVAGQAAAAGASNATVRVGDRVGASTSESNDFIGGLPLPVLLIGAAVVVATVVVATDDDSESD